MDMSVFTRKFVDEARDRLKALGGALLRLEEAPASDDIIADIFREAHSLKGSALMLGFVDISQIAHRLEDLFVAAKRDVRVIDAMAFDLIFRALDMISARVEELAQGKSEPVDTTELNEQFALLVLAFDAPAEGDTRPVVAPSGPATGLLRAPAPNARPTGPALSLRVPVEKLESLANLAPEMVIQSLKTTERHDELRRVDAALSRLRDRVREVRLAASTGSRAAELGEYADAIDAISRQMRALLANFRDDRVRLTLITEELRQHVIELTMMPLSTVFDAFPRAVRDLARSFGKQVELTIVGRETELEKKIIEQIADPLVHLIRNAIDHGIEAPDERVRRGKGPAGNVRVSAEQRGNRILVVVADDGRGIDPAELRASAVRKGFATASDLAQWSNEQLLDLIFEPGFSTRTATTDVSGRGVGMDVVRVVVDGLGGAVRVQSEPQWGTTIVLDLPLTLALLRVVLVEVNDERFAIPTASVRRVIRLTPESAPQLQQGRVVESLGEAIPLAELSALLQLPPAAATEETAIVVDAGGTLFGVIVNAVHAEQELVFKELRGPLRDQRTFAGAALVGNGDIVPILDVQALFELAKRSAGRGVGPAAPAAAANRQGRVLVVEDSLVAGELLKGILLTAGYDADIAHNGVEALDALREREWDLVISDVDMPRMDGFELTTRLRADHRLHDIPVIILTSRDSDENRRRGIEAGADAYVTKREFDQSQILESVRRLLGRGRESTAPPSESARAEEGGGRG